MLNPELEIPRTQGVRFFLPDEYILPINWSWGLEVCVSQPKIIGDLGEAFMTLTNFGAGSRRLGKGLILDKGSLAKGEARFLDAINGLLFLDIGVRDTPGIPIVCRMESRELGYELELESDVILFGDEKAIFGLAAQWRAPEVEEPFSLYIPRNNFLEIVGKMEFFFRGKT